MFHLLIFQTKHDEFFILEYNIDFSSVSGIVKPKNNPKTGSIQHHRICEFSQTLR